MINFFKEMWQEDRRSAVLFVIGMFLLFVYLPLFYCFICYKTGVPILR